jgi:hypothetical protein
MSITLCDGAHVACVLDKFGFDWRVGAIAVMKKIPNFPAKTVVLYKITKFGSREEPIEIEIVHVPTLPEEINRFTIGELNKKITSGCVRTFYTMMSK